MNPSSFDAPSLAAMNELLPAFDFKAVLSSHAYGVVYAAGQRSLDRDVAVKLLSPQASADPTFRSTFEANSRAMASLNHPNLISLFDSGLVNGMLYSISEFVPGKPLARSLAGSPVEWQLALQLTSAIADGLEHAHSNGIVHGWLDPSDILLTPKVEPKIGNFGLGNSFKVAKGVASAPTAPEIAAGASPDVRADVFALGAIFYELITGVRHSQEATPPSSQISCQPEVDTLWMKATHPIPALRFQSVAEFQQALKALQPTADEAVKATATERSDPHAAMPASRVKSPPAADLSPPAPTGEVSGGGGGGIFRHVVVIACVSYAVSFAWDHYQKKLAADQPVQAQTVEESPTSNRDGGMSPLPEPENRANLPGSVVTPNKVTTAEIAESPEESLERLKMPLVQGKRTELPKSTITQGENHYFLVKTRLTWPEAAHYCEQYGGHIAIPSQSANLQWLADKFFTEPGIWLGAGRSGSKQWTLADATSWKPAKEPAGTGNFLALDKSGLLHAANTQLRLPFVIQWRNDGKNPGTLKHWLATTRTTLTTPSPIFPPGTRSYDQRHFLWVAQETTWDDAKAIAETSGGHLAAPSNLSEIAALEDLTRDLDPSNVLWLGGSNLNQSWQWVSGEPWKTVRWAKGATSDTPDCALIIRPGSGWDTRKPSRNAKGFLIEWSSDRTTQSASPPTFSSPILPQNAPGAEGH